MVAGVQTDKFENQDGSTEDVKDVQQELTMEGTMAASRTKKVIVILLHAFIGWALCGAIIGIGRGITSMETTLILHAIGAPIIFIVLSLIYCRWFAYTTPLQTALVFIGFVIFMDLFLVALLIEKSFEMFASILGTWLPFVLIFLATYITCLSLKKRP